MGKKLGGIKGCKYKTSWLLFKEKSLVSEKRKKLEHVRTSGLPPFQNLKPRGNRDEKIGTLGKKLKAARKKAERCAEYIIGKARRTRELV